MTPDRATELATALAEEARRFAAPEDAAKRIAFHVLTRALEILRNGTTS